LRTVSPFKIETITELRCPALYCLPRKDSTKSRPAGFSVSSAKRSHKNQILQKFYFVKSRRNFAKLFFCKIARRRHPNGPLVYGITAAIPTLTEIDKELYNVFRPWPRSKGFATITACKANECSRKTCVYRDQTIFLFGFLCLLESNLVCGLVCLFSVKS
jgi:hypothetical protein